MRTAGVAALVLCACHEPSIDPGYFEVIASPGSDLLDRIERLRVPGYRNATQYETVRGPDGLDLTIEIADFGDSGCGDPIPTVVEGYDANGTLIANGELVFCRVARGRARGRVFLAPPNSITPAPAQLGVARSEVVGHAFGDTAVFAGGRAANGAVSDALDVYDACWHEVTTATLPFPRAGLSLFDHNGISGYGGTGPDGTPTASLVHFTIAPDASITFDVLADFPGFERTGQRALGTGGGEVVITGDPPLSLDVNDTTVGIRPNTPPLSPNAAATWDSSFPVVVGVINPGVVDLIRFGDTPPKQVSLPAGRDLARIIGRSGDVLEVVGGSETSLLEISASKAMIYDVAENALDQPRFDASIGAESNATLVIGGVDANGAPIATAEYLAGGTHIATTAVTPRRHPVVVPLPAGQFAIAGGDDATDVIELFTPARSGIECLHDEY